MMSEDVLHDRKFQLERLILFSDAVFAIAITLLVIEIKAPEFQHDATRREMLGSLLKLTPKFIGFFISFLVISIYWTIHHRMFGYLRDYNTRLIWLNLLFLMMVVLMPFFTALYSENFGANFSYMVYSLYLVGLGMVNYWLWKYIGNPAHKLTSGLEDPRKRRYFRARSLVVAGVFFLGFLFCLFDHPVFFWLSRMSPGFIGPALSIVNRRFKMKPTVK